MLYYMLYHSMFAALLYHHKLPLYIIFTQRKKQSYEGASKSTHATSNGNPMKVLLSTFYKASVVYGIVVQGPFVYKLL